MESLRELFKIGFGPSSSHTMGPQRAASKIKEQYPNASRFEVELYGSLALTGKGHLTDYIIKQTLGKQTIVRFKSDRLPYHPNGMKFYVYQDEKILDTITAYSIGGGTVEYEGSKLQQTKQIYPHKNLKEIIQYIEENRLSVTAGELADKYPNINEILSGLDKKYEYGNEIFTVLAPHCIEDILKEGQALHHCIDKKTEYLERINEQETYILFLRKTEQPDKPYYTLEVEPGGVIRQKRTEYDRQNKDIEEASEFLKEWQREIQKRITASDKKLADKSRQLRIESYAEMRKKKVKINGGLFQGKYLADVLEADLMEMPDTIEHAA